MGHLFNIENYDKRRNDVDIAVHSKVKAFLKRQYHGLEGTKL